MDIGTIIKKYREDNNLSLRDFASKCGTSHSYIAMLENGKNSKTGEPIIPTITMMKKISTALDTNINDLISTCEDMPITLGRDKERLSSKYRNITIFEDYEAINNSPTEPQLSEGERKLLELFRQLPEESQRMYLEVLRATLKNQA